MKDSVAVSIKGVKKQFDLPHEREDSIKLKILNSFKKNHTKGHNVYKALKGIDLDIKKGEFIGILGRNGAGKSTLLKIIAEIYRPSEGTISVRGKLVPFIELGVGFNPNLSGRDNIYLNGAMLGFSRKEIDNMYDEIVDFAELRDFMDQKLKNYSSGMQVRLAFSMAIRADGDILLLDEVLAVGDASFQKKCNDYFDSLGENRKTVILVTHSMSAVRKYCDRGVLIEGGRIVYEGSGIAAAEAYQKLFNKEKDETQQKTKEDFIDLLKVSEPNLVLSEENIEISADIENTTDKEIKDIDVILEIYKLSEDRLKRQLIAGVGKDMNLESADSIGIKAHEKIKIKGVMDNIFGRADFSIDIILKDTETREVLARKEEVILFTSRNDKTGYLPIIPNAKFKKVV